MPQNDEISLIVDEVSKDIETRQVSFHRALSWALHRRKIFHCENREQYNFYFRKVHGRYKARQGRAKLSQALSGPRVWQRGKKQAAPARPRPANNVGRTRLKPGIEVEVLDDPYLPSSSTTQLSFFF